MTAPADDTYQTIDHPSEYEIKIKSSRFLAESAAVSTVEEAQAVLGKIRKREHAATHHCYAYRIGLGSDVVFKHSDDGEPSGTAGRPVYDVICGADLTYVLVVVTRYFGGTKLGTGGLARAYGEAAKGVLERSGRRQNFLTEEIRIEMAISLYDQLLKILNRYPARQLASDFSDRVALVVQVRRSLAERLKSDITQLSGGKARIETGD